MRKSCAHRYFAVKVLCGGLVRRPCAPQDLVLCAKPWGAQDRAQDFYSEKALCEPCALPTPCDFIREKPCASLVAFFFLVDFLFC